MENINDQTIVVFESIIDNILNYPNITFEEIMNIVNNNPLLKNVILEYFNELNINSLKTNDFIKEKLIDKINFFKLVNFIQNELSNNYSINILRNKVYNYRQSLLDNGAITFNLASDIDNLFFKKSGAFWTEAYNNPNEGDIVKKSCGCTYIAKNVGIFTFNLSDNEILNIDLIDT
jgi:hypothetical protein